MKILKEAGTFEVLSKTDNVIEMIATAARTCYKSEDKASPEADQRLVKNIISRGHHAMIEFADLTVRFDNVSRGFTHEMVRHRHCSFAQESTRYVDESNLHVVVPPHKDKTEVFDNQTHQGLTLEGHFAGVENVYRRLLSEGYKPEDARQVLPIATKATICVKANLREWRHIFKMRCDKFAHWEIRVMMLQLLVWCKNNIPVVFDDFEFFETEGGEKMYAQPVMSQKNLDNELKLREKADA